MSLIFSPSLPTLVINGVQILLVYAAAFVQRQFFYILREVPSVHPLLLQNDAMFELSRIFNTTLTSIYLLL